MAFRIGQPIRTSLRHRLRVANVVTGGPRRGQPLPHRARRSTACRSAPASTSCWRFLTPDGWWRSHPYSISAAPNGEWLRITVKDLGDGSRDLARVPIGTRVIVEGPYGILTDVERTKPGVLLIAGGIGITPLRALLEALPARPRRHHPALSLASRPQDVVFRDELEILARRRGIAVHYLIGQRGSAACRAIRSTPAGS